MLNLTPPRHTPTLPSTSDLAADFDLVRFPPNSNARAPASLEEETADSLDGNFLGGSAERPIFLRMTLS